MDKVFISILNMSLTGTFVVVVIMFARFPLKKLPKIISYCLWAVAGFRFVFPYSITSIISLIPFKAAPIPYDIATQAVPRIDSGITAIDNTINSILPAAVPDNSVNPLQVWAAIGASVWFIGLIAMSIYGIASYFLLKHKMHGITAGEDNIYEADNIQSPFLLGVIKPKIYVPAELSEQERNYVIIHERVHIQRYDHIVKFIAYFILCLHWFNPFTWAAFMLMGVDMEMSCDEQALKDMGEETRRDYSLSLLSLASDKRIIGGSPLAFGEGGIKERIKNVLRIKKHSRIVIISAVVLVSILSVGFTVNSNENIMSITHGSNQYQDNVNKDVADSEAILVTGNEQNTPKTMIALLKEVNVELNGNGIITQLFAYELNSLQYFRIQDICQSADFYVTCAGTPKTIWISTDRSYENDNGIGLPNPDKKTAYVKLDEIQIYCNGLLYKASSSFTINGDVYVTINDIVSATNNSANLLDMPNSSQPPGILLLESDSRIVSEIPSISSGDTCRYLTMYYDKAADILRLSVVTKLLAKSAIVPDPSESGGKQWIPIYPIQSQATLLSYDELEIDEP